MQLRPMIFPAWLTCTPLERSSFLSFFTFHREWSYRAETSNCTGRASALTSGS